MEKIILSYFQTLAAAFVIMGTVYGIVWYFFGNRLHNRKIQLSKRAGWTQIRGEMWHGALSLIGGTLFQMLVFSLKDRGLTKLYTDVAEYGMAYFVVSVVVLLFVSDAWFYWLHRWMHHPRLYKYVHALHHKSLDVNPFTSNSFHVLESIALTVWVLPLVVIMPISGVALGIIQVVGTLNNLKSHLGYELFPGFFRAAPFNMLVTATNHSLHHTQYNGNYGLYFRYWDQWCGTELNSTDALFHEIHRRENEQITDNTTYKKIHIHRLVKETVDTISVYFKPSDPTFYHYEAGQYLTLRVKVKGKIHERCFSLSSSPLDDFLRITVRLKGEVSHYFFHDAKEGDTIESLYPVGEFVLPKESDAEGFVMIAGGSGITALYSMITTLLRQHNTMPITLFYANKSADNIIFREEVETLAATHPNFTYRNVVAGDRRITTDDLRAHTRHHFYICGPDSLKSSIMADLQTLHVEKAKIHIEHYADGYVPWFGLFQQYAGEPV